ncbi:MAG TPA: glycosyltransferase [Pilimelia sp.]|nr:glycosyltransferase [Pilimelia sp.]
MPQQRAGTRTGTVLAVVGTDVHRFDRLVRWLADWHAGHPAPCRLVVQYGHSHPPDLPDAVPVLDHAGLQRAMAEATLVVSHGGPATITEARRHGHLPIVVPRDPAHGEHVDDHQQRFARRLAAAGLVRLCEARADLHAALDAGLADPSRYAVAADGAVTVPPGVARVGAIVDALVASRWRRRR